MAKKYDGWVVKNKWGSLLFWTFKETQKETQDGVSDWEQWKKLGFKLVKVKFVEVE